MLLKRHLGVGRFAAKTIRAGRSAGQKGPERSSGPCFCYKDRLPVPRPRVKCLPNLFPAGGIICKVCANFLVTCLSCAQNTVFTQEHQADKLLCSPSSSSVRVWRREDDVLPGCAVEAEAAGCALACHWQCLNLWIFLHAHTDVCRCEGVLAAFHPQPIPVKY